MAYNCDKTPAWFQDSLCQFCKLAIEGNTFLAIGRVCKNKVDRVISYLSPFSCIGPNLSSISDFDSEELIASFWASSIRWNFLIWLYPLSTFTLPLETLSQTSLGNFPVGAESAIVRIFSSCRSLTPTISAIFSLVRPLGKFPEGYLL